MGVRSRVGLREGAQLGGQRRARHFAFAAHRGLGALASRSRPLSRVHVR